MQLTTYFKDVIEKTWVDFCRLENDTSVTSLQGVVLSLVRACYGGKLPAIKEALNRTDGKVVQEIKVEYPQFYFLYPYATDVVGGESSTDSEEVVQTAPTPDFSEEPVTGSLRDTLDRMSARPRVLVDQILGSADIAEKAYMDGVTSAVGDGPLVKSVIVAGLLKLAHGGHLSAVFEVFDRIDGAVADTVKVLGEDVFITCMDKIAPAGAKKNVDGIYQLSAANTTNQWVTALERRQINGR